MAAVKPSKGVGEPKRSNQVFGCKWGPLRYERGRGRTTLDRLPVGPFLFFNPTFTICKGRDRCRDGRTDPRQEEGARGALRKEAIKTGGRRGGGPSERDDLKCPIVQLKGKFLAFYLKRRRTRKPRGERY